MEFTKIEGTHVEGVYLSIHHSLLYIALGSLILSSQSKEEEEEMPLGYDSSSTACLYLLSLTVELIY